MPEVDNRILMVDKTVSGRKGKGVLFEFYGFMV